MLESSNNNNNNNEEEEEEEYFVIDLVPINNDNNINNATNSTTLTTANAADVVLLKVKTIKQLRMLFRVPFESKLVLMNVSLINKNKIKNINNFYYYSLLLSCVVTKINNYSVEWRLSSREHEIFASDVGETLCARRRHCRAEAVFGIV